MGQTQFVQFVNDSFEVFNKSDGSLAYGPANGNTLWQALGAPCSTSNVDEIAQYDKLANRWVMLMPLFTSPQPYLCIAVSTTSDATLSPWNLYAFPIPQNISCTCKPSPDYPKLAVWPDAYYIAYGQAENGNIYSGPAACAVDRNAMLQGAAAPNMQCFTNDGATNGVWLAADLDGTAPPPTGSPEYLLNLDPNDTSLDIWQMHLDWTTPANSTLTGPTQIPVAVFTEPCGDTAPLFTPVDNCVPQAGTSTMLNAYGDRLMYRLAYRNFGTYEALVANHTVQVPTNTNTQTGINWYELRNSGSGSAFGVYQQGTFAPDSSYRWMGSIAMDGAGEIALGYSISSASTSPSIAYTGRVPSDPLGQMESEIDVLATAVPPVAPASQTSSSRWADYSSMAIDPTDDCTFWYTTEYVPTPGNNNWDTRIASFSFPTCKSTLTVTPSGTGTGTVTSSPPGINCPGQCSSTFASGSSVTLTATPASGSGFGGWSGACSGTTACTVTMTGNQTVGASFGPPDFTVTPSPSSAKVSAGGVASFNLAIAGVGGFTSAVTLSCTAPTTQGVNCSLASASTTPGSSVSLTVTTTGPSAALTLPPGTTRWDPVYAAWVGLPALALVGIGSARLGSRKRRLTCLLFCAALLGSVALQMACGSNSSGTKNSGTPPGTYTVNINATSGATQHSSSVTVTVQ